jgi:hypothetical protein
VRTPFAITILCSVMLAACEPAAIGLGGAPADAPVAPVLVPSDPSLAKVRVHEEGVQACEAPEERAELGPFERRQSAAPATSMRYLWASGLLVGDLDNDGLHDIIAPTEPYAQLFHGETGGVTQLPSLRGFDLSMGAGGTLADYDGDGDLDVLLTRFQRPDRLLRNDGDGRFSDVTETAGLGEAGPSTCSTWADVDGDGDLDVFVGRYGDLLGDGAPAPSKLYENQGDGTFVDRSEHLPDEVQGAFTRMAGFHDLDGDSLPELLVVNDLGDPSALLWNRGGRFVADDGSSGFGQAVRGAGLGVGELDGDGVPDLLVTEWGRMSLLQSGGGDGWIDHASPRGLRSDVGRGQEVPWGAELVDLDNDGDLDALVAYGHLEVEGYDWYNPEEQPDAVFLQAPDGTFVDTAEAWGMADRGVGRGFVAVDLDRDGFLDLVKRDLVGSSVMYLSRCDDRAWLRVRLDQPGRANGFAVGATVRVWVGERFHQRTVTAGGTGFGSGGPPELHFGLGMVDEVDSIEVIWPDGERSVVGATATRQGLQLTRD